MDIYWEMELNKEGIIVREIMDIYLDLDTKPKCIYILLEMLS